MPLRRYLALLALVAMTGICARARAQAGGITASATAAPAGGGIRLGDALVLHLGLGVETGWDSNVFFQPDTPTSPATNAFYLRLNPSFDLTNRPRQGTRAFQLDLHGGLGYVEYLSNRDVTADNRQFNVD